jgi:hypothetical protein
MAYLNTIPAAADLLALSQGQLLENFAQLETQFSIDHSSLLAGAATGKHTQVTLPEFATAVYPVTAAGEGAVFTEDDAVTAQPELNYREESNGDVVKLTHEGYTNTFVKAFCYFNAAGVLQGTGYNVSAPGVVRNAIGVYTITFDTALTDANYVAIVTAQSNVGRERAVDIVSKLAASIQVRCYISSSGAPGLIDASMNVVIYRITA